ncbi:MAG TPA: hypothetical protein VIW73_02865 [Candidatus Cybelea sp.]
MTTQDSRAPDAAPGTKGASHKKRNEFTLVAKVKPGHEKEIREGVGKIFRGEAGGDPIKIAADTSLHDARFVLFDDDTRFALMTSFEGSWDKYFDDHFAAFGSSWNVAFKHCEGYDENWLAASPVDVDSWKKWLHDNQVTAAAYGTKYSDATVKEIHRALRLQKAFEEVLDNPDAAKALEHPALRPLLELAAD